MGFWNQLHCTTQLPFGLLLASWSLNLIAAAPDFSDYTIESPYSLMTAPIAADIADGNGKEILLFSVDEKHARHLLVYQFDAQLNDFKIFDKVQIPPSYHSYDISEYKPGLKQTLLFLASHELSQYQPRQGEKPGSLNPQLKLNTLILKESADFLARSHFINNLNQDEYPDLIVSDFESTQLFIGSDKGYSLQTLPIKADVIVGNRGATYANPKLFIADINQDQQLDIVKVETGSLFAFRQDQHHRFSKQPIQLPIEASINGTDWWYKRDSNGEELDQSNLVYRKVDELKDLNNDGLPDMVVRFSQSSGVLERTNDYEIYLGRVTDGKFSLPLTPNSTIQADGTLSDFELVDINGDNIFEVMLSGFDIGLTQIIGALISGSINQDVYIFAQDEASNFNDTPLMKENVSLKFSLSSGRSGSAVVALGDVNGDGHKELLLSKNTKALSIFSGNPEKSTFDRKATRYKTQLPEDSSNLSVADINDDNNDDILFHYGKLDDEGLAKTIKILLSK